MMQGGGGPMGFARARTPAAVIEALDDLAHSELFGDAPLIDGAYDLGLVFLNHQIPGDAVILGNVAIAVRGFTAQVVAGPDFLQPPAAKALLEQRAFVLRHCPLDL